MKEDRDNDHLGVIQKEDVPKWLQPTAVHTSTLARPPATDPQHRDTAYEASSREGLLTMIEKKFDVSFIADLALHEKQIQQNYRLIIPGVRIPRHAKGRWVC